MNEFFDLYLLPVPSLSVKFSGRDPDTSLWAHKTHCVSSFSWAWAGEKMSVALSRHRGRHLSAPAASLPFSHHVIIAVWGLFWWFLVARRPLEALGKRVCQFPLEKSPFSYWQRVLRTDRCLRLVVWGQRQPFPAPFSWQCLSVRPRVSSLSS